MKTSFNPQKIQRDFPILQQSINGKPLVYLDNAATTQKPQAVIDAISYFYAKNYANVHRGVHALSQRATDMYEKSRTKIRHFINAQHNHEIIFTSGTTDSINLVAQSYGRTHLKAGDEIIISTMEHHSNIVPWQMLCHQTGAVLRVIPINDAGELLLDEYQRLLSPRTKIVALVHLSNALGTINPIKQMIELAQQHGAITLIDGAQAVAHLPIDVQALNCDFYVFSSHKLFGPSGVGVLYGKTKLLEHMPPCKGGGDMIKMVSFEKTLYNDLPYKFEAGTPPIAQVIGFGAAIDYINQVGLTHITQYEQELLHYATETLQNIPGLKIIGTAKQKAGILAFTLEGIHAHDIGTIVDNHGVAIRSGHHCTMPLMEHFKIAATARASLAFYNTREDIDALITALKKVREVLR